MDIQWKPLQNTTIDSVTLLKSNLQSQDSLSLLIWKIPTGYSKSVESFLYRYPYIKIESTKQNTEIQWKCDTLYSYIFY